MQRRVTTLLLVILMVIIFPATIVEAQAASDKETCTNHNYTNAGGDYCTICGYKYEAVLTSYQKTMEVINANTYSRNTPYENSNNIVKMLSIGTVVKVTHFLKNSLGDTWYLTSDGYYIFRNNLQVKSVTITLNFDANGGQNAPSAQSGNGSMATKIPNNVPTRSGYTFKGWATNRNATNAEYQPGNVITIHDSTTLYAVWESVKKTCVVQFNANGGVVDSNAFVTQAGNKYGDLPIPTRSGYVFDGWYTAANGGSRVTASSIVTSDITLYAHWSTEQSEKSEICTIRFNSNGGTRDYTSYTKAGYNYGPLPTPTRDGYTFDGWYTAANGGSRVTESSIVTGDIILYAHWTSATQTYTVTYNANGGNGTPSVSRGINITIPSSPIPTRKGYTFLGYAESATAKTPTYTLGQKFVATKNMTLYAVWESTQKTCANHNYTNAGGDYCTVCGHKYEAALTEYPRTMEVVNANTPLRNSPYENSSNIIKTLAKGAVIEVTHFFKNSLGETWYLTSDGYYIFRDYLQIKKTELTLSFDANGGQNAPPSQSGSSSTLFQIPNTVPIRSGYTFKGWAQNKNATRADYQPGASIIIVENTTYYAVWESAQKTCTSHKYTSAGGDYCTVCGYKFEPKITPLDTVVYATSDNVPIRNNYYAQNSEVTGTLKKNANVRVKGSLVNSVGRTWYVIADGVYVYSENVTTTKPNVTTYTITYNANGGKGAPGISKGINITITSSPVPTRTGYIFLGYAESATAKTPTYALGQKFVATRNLTLYAVWEKINTDLRNVPGVAQNQNGDTGTCTTAATAVLLARRLVVDKKSELFTYQDVRNSCKKAYNKATFGLCNMSNGSTVYSLKSETFSTIRNDTSAIIERIIALLKKHDEGIVLYFNYPGQTPNSGHHAIVISDYELLPNGEYQFYAYDSGNSAKLGRMKLEKTWLYTSKLGNPSNYKEIFSKLNDGHLYFKSGSTGICAWYVDKEVK